MRTLKENSDPFPDPSTALRSLLPRHPSAAREYIEVTAVILAITVVIFFTPLDYRLFGDVYLAAVIALGLRVGRWPVLYAAVFSVLAWNYAVVPPKLAFSKLELKDGVFLGTYFAAALVAGQLTARLRVQERRERQREQRATALFHLSRALSAAQNFNEGVAAALQQADALFAGRSNLLLVEPDGELAPHPASTLTLSPIEQDRAAEAHRLGLATGRAPGARASTEAMHVPLARPGGSLGIFTVGGWPRAVMITAEDHELIETFAAQIALHVERERLRAAGEREKLLAESDRLHRTLLDSVSHELKTPLAVLRSAAENLATEDPARRQSLTAEVQTATERLNRLVSNLLNQSRLEAGRLAPKLDWCDVRDIIGAARRSAEPALAGRNLTIAIPAEMPIFKADFLLLEQAVVNLLVNAALHTPAGTPIAVETGADRASQRIFIAVTDHGPGVDAELRERLFQKFQRGPGARPGGLGLGLSIVHGFMLAQGGEVAVGNRADGGARFTLYLPCLSHENVPHE